MRKSTKNSHEFQWNSKIVKLSLVRKGSQIFCSCRVYKYLLIRISAIRLIMQVVIFKQNSFSQIQLEMLSFFRPICLPVAVARWA